MQIDQRFHEQSGCDNQQDGQSDLSGDEHLSWPNG